MTAWRKHEAELKRIENANKKLEQDLKDKENQEKKQKETSQLNQSRTSYYDKQNAKTDQEIQSMLCLSYYFHFLMHNTCFCFVFEQI